MSLHQQSCQPGRRPFSWVSSIVRRAFLSAASRRLPARHWRCPACSCRASAIKERLSTTASRKAFRPERMCCTIGAVVFVVIWKAERAVDDGYGTAMPPNPEGKPSSSRSASLTNRPVRLCRNSIQRAFSKGGRWSSNRACVHDR